MFGFSRSQQIAFLIMLALIIVCPFVLYPVFLMRVLCVALFACAFNLMIGYVGLLSFGHAAFFGMGSYIAAWTMKFWHVDAAIAIILGGATGAVLGLCLGYLAIRRSGIYFAMITLALAQMVYFFCVEAPFTGGEDGIQQVPRGHLFGVIPLDNDMTMYWLVAAVFVGGFLLIHRIIHSPFGQVLKAIRENEPRATSLGYRTDDYKLIAFVLSCMLAGVAGGTKALVFGIATLTDVHYSTSGEVVLTTLLGGLGTVFGPAMGAVLVTTMENYLAQFGQWVTVTQGAIFVICVLAFRRGVDRRDRRGAAAGAVGPSGGGDDPPAVPYPEADAFVAVHDQKIRIEHDLLLQQFAQDHSRTRCLAVQIARQPRDPHRHADFSQKFDGHRPLPPPRAGAHPEHAEHDQQRHHAKPEQAEPGRQQRTRQHAVRHAAAHRHAEDGSDQSHRQPGLVLVPEARCETLQLRLLVCGKCLKRHRLCTLLIENLGQEPRLPEREVYRTAWPLLAAVIGARAVDRAHQALPFRQTVFRRVAPLLHPFRRLAHDEFVDLERRRTQRASDEFQLAGTFQAVHAEKNAP